MERTPTPFSPETGFNEDDGPILFVKDKVKARLLTKFNQGIRELNDGSNGDGNISQAEANDMNATTKNMIAEAARVIFSDDEVKKWLKQNEAELEADGTGQVADLLAEAIVARFMLQAEEDIAPVAA